MGRVLVTGNESQNFLQYLTSNDVSALGDGRGQYTLLCNPEGGIEDDLLAFKLERDRFMLVYNAANRTSDYAWFAEKVGGFRAKIDDVSDQVALFAVQGPKAAGLVAGVAGDSTIEALPRFGCVWAQISGSRVLLTRTGYTGEDGFEVFVWDSPLSDAKRAEAVWEKFLQAGRSLGIEQCGLGARDLLRLEAGMCLYGMELDAKTNPFEARLGFVVKLQKEFVGRTALEQVKQSGPKRLRVGIVTQNRVIPRHGCEIFVGGEQVGVVTSGTLSPIIKTGIAMGYVTSNTGEEGAGLDIRIHGRFEPAFVRKMPFYDTARYGYLRKDS
jgi:aminomethyltransferase